MRHPHSLELPQLKTDAMPIAMPYFWGHRHMMVITGYEDMTLFATTRDK